MNTTRATQQGARRARCRRRRRDTAVPEASSRGPQAQVALGPRRPQAGRPSGSPRGCWWSPRSCCGRHHGGRGPCPVVRRAGPAQIGDVVRRIVVDGSAAAGVVDGCHGRRRGRGARAGRCGCWPDCWRRQASACRLSQSVGDPDGGGAAISRISRWCRWWEARDHREQGSAVASAVCTLVAAVFVDAVGLDLRGGLREHREYGGACLHGAGRRC